MLKKLLLVTAGIVLMATSARNAGAESSLDFTLVNSTGYGIKAIHIAPSASSEWGDNILSDVLEDGQSVAITFQPKAGAIAKWDFLISWEEAGDPDVHWTGYELAKINKITLKYNRKTDQTSAVVE